MRWEGGGIKLALFSLELWLLNLGSGISLLLHSKKVLEGNQKPERPLKSHSDKLQTTVRPTDRPTHLTLKELIRFIISLA